MTDRQIRKYTLLLDTAPKGALWQVVLELPVNRKLLNVDNQGRDICLWFEVRDDGTTAPVKFYVYTTGEDIHDGLCYVGSTQFHSNSRYLVCHLYTDFPEIRA